MNRAVRSAALRVSLQAAFYTLLTLSFFSGVSIHAQSAKALIKQGQAAEAREDFDAAYRAYQQAYTKYPRNMQARTSMYRVQPNAAAQHMAKGRQLLQAGDETNALTEFLRAAEIDPGNDAAAQEIAAIRKRQGSTAPAASPGQAEVQQELNSMASPVVLKPVSNEPLTLHMSQDSKTIYQAIGRAAGINVLFDPDYTSKNIQVDLTNSTLMDALRIVGILSNTFWRPITANTIFVAQNSRSKRTELDEQAVQTFYLTNAWQQNDLNDVQTALRNVLQNIKVYGVASQNALVVRGTPDELLLAQKLISDLDKARPEVVVDIAIMEVSKNWERNLGLSWPSSVGVTLQPQTSTTTTGTSTTTTTGTSTTVNPTIYDFAHLNSTDFSVSMGAATANLLLTDSNTRILQNPRLRATDMQKATMKIGQRIPYATGSYQTGAATALVSSLVNTQFQYVDLGVNIEITPTVHFNRDVTLKMKIEVTAQAGSTTISGVTEPIIAQKTSEQTVRLREGEANILSGILNQQDQVSWGGIPGLSSIPILKYLFGSKDHTISNDEVVFLLVPHVVRAQNVNATNLRPIDTGVGQSIELRRLPLEGPGTNAPAQVQQLATQSIAPHAPTMPGTVPGQSAAGAAPAAMNQMRSTVAAPPAQQVPQPNLNGKQPQNSPAGTPPVAPPGPSNPAAPGTAHVLMNSPGPVANGATFQVPVVVSGATDLSALPLQIQYDPARLALVNVGLGDLLSRDGQSVAETHRDDGPGMITMNLSRPRGATGVNGAGVACVLMFQAKTPGETTIAVTRAGAMNSQQQPIPAQGSQISVQVK